MALRLSLDSASMAMSGWLPLRRSGSGANPDEMERRPKVPPHLMSPPVGERIFKGVPEDNAKMPPTDGREALPRPKSGAERMEELPPSHARFAWHVQYSFGPACDSLGGRKCDRWIFGLWVKLLLLPSRQQHLVRLLTAVGQARPARPSAKAMAAFSVGWFQGFRKPQARRRNSAPAAGNDGGAHKHEQRRASHMTWAVRPERANQQAGMRRI
ncbi:uncharacterized protein PSANT_00552 [Moesziomyces antarcticus]|uniref:Uncharacterized protein n=1 Tax=Pseudozyma antarctica TaxID=84753 RepID=A0A5C3FEP3_PSEA2|nr:uncharacterized protein PSANT_00552 [Moesziomyces antarcticus]